MWFKNLHLYRLHDMPAIDPAYLEQALAEHSARPLGGSEPRRIGWQPPAGRSGTQRLHELQGHRLMSALRQERLLPSEVVREQVEERAGEIETREGRKLRRQEKLAIKEQVFEELLPQAFVKRQRIDLWWDIGRELIGVNCASRTRAEEVLDLGEYDTHHRCLDCGSPILSATTEKQVDLLLEQNRALTKCLEEAMEVIAAHGIIPPDKPRPRLRVVRDQGAKP